MNLVEQSQLKCTKIAFVLVYEHMTISYNEYLQRLGCYYQEAHRKQKYYGTFYTSEQVLISLESEQTLVLDHQMKFVRMMEENNPKFLIEEPAFLQAEYDARHMLYSQFSTFIPGYFQLIQSLEFLLDEAGVKEKYHSEFFIDLYATFKIFHFSFIHKDLVQRVLNRIKKEMISDIYHAPQKSSFCTINDVLYDELSQLGIYKAMLELNKL
jgi:hypothetical protein